MEIQKKKIKKNSGEDGCSRMSGIGGVGVFGP